jgi:exopolysaccharide biosynthesis polyprenyl glycosylphosphotransferase
MSGYPDLKEAPFHREKEISNYSSSINLDVYDNTLYNATKRAVDLVVAVLLLILFMPVIPVVAILIKLDSKGPVIYKQKRIGKGGMEFNFYKFRSMYDKAEETLEALKPLSKVEGPIFKLKKDPRVTPVGRFLRKSSLDELPQLLNVVKGEMSIVGPRPNLPSEVLHYQPWQNKRLEVVPGITCLWQIAGRSHIGFKEWMRLDIEYIRNRTILTDIKIMIKTIPAVIQRKGAY